MTTEELDKLARIFGDKLCDLDRVDFTDFIGTGITLENIDEVAKHFEQQMRECAEYLGDEFSGLQVSYYAPIQ